MPEPEREPVTAEPVEPTVEAAVLRFLEELGVPKRPRFSPTHLAQDLGGTERTWQRHCRLGDIEACRLPGGWVVTPRALIAFLARRHNLASLN